MKPEKKTIVWITTLFLPLTFITPYYTWKYSVSGDLNRPEVDGIAWPRIAGYNRSYS
jgi:hypothetical protein